MAALFESALFPACSQADDSSYTVPQWVLEENRALPRNPIPLDLVLPSIQFGDVRLTLSASKITGEPDPSPTLRYTSGNARRDLEQSLRAGQASRLGLRGETNGLSFSLSRQNASGGSFMDGRLGWASGDVQMSFRWREVDRTFSKTKLTSNQEWSDAKDLLGWRQSDISLSWNPDDTLRLQSTLVRAHNTSLDESRKKDRLELGWKPASETEISLFTESESTDRPDHDIRGKSSGITLNHRFSNGASLALQGVTRKSGPDPSTRSTRLVFQTLEKARTFMRAEQYDTHSGDKRKTETRLALRTAFTDSLRLESTWLAQQNGAVNTKDTHLQVDWRLAPEWNFLGSVRRKSGVRGLVSDLHLTANPAPGTRVDARLLRVPEASQPFSRQDLLHWEQSFGKKTRLFADYQGVQTKSGIEAKCFTGRWESPIPYGSGTAGFRTGGNTVFPDYIFANLQGATDRNNLSWNLLWKSFREGASSDKVDVTWTIRDGLCLTAAYVRNPESSEGRLENRESSLVSMNWCVRKDLHVSAAAGTDRIATVSTDRLDLSLKGQLDKANAVDVSFSARQAPASGPSCAWKLAWTYETNPAQRFMVRAEQTRKLVQSSDDFMARLEWLTTF